MWYLVSIAFVVGFIVGVMFGRHNRNKAVLIDGAVDDVADKVMDKIKVKAQDMTSAACIKEAMLNLANSDMSVRRAYNIV